MGTCDVWITRAHHDALMKHLFPGDGDEHGAILHAGIVGHGEDMRLTVCNVVPARPEHYGPGRHGYRALDPRFIHQHITRCRDARLAYLAVHNHDCDDAVGFSRIDMESHDRGYPALRDIGKGIPVGALVYGRRSAEADVWLPDGSRRRLGEMRVVGSSIERLYASPRFVTGSATMFDRQIRLFGAEGQALLAASRIAVVGLGGVGSLVSEYLARLGVGELILVDSDRVEETNLSRIVGATIADARIGERKTRVAQRVATEANPAISTTLLDDDVARRPVSAQLAATDFIFLCADSMRARLACNAITQQYFVPMVQLGAKIAERDGHLDAFSAVRQVRPGSGCLWCNGWIDPHLLALEMKSDDERKAQAYGTGQPNPSVITLNAVAAAHGVNDFLFDYLRLRPEQDAFQYEHFHHVGQRIERVAARAPSECPECTRRLGLGDAVPLPGIA